MEGVADDSRKFFAVFFSRTFDPGEMHVRPKRPDIDLNPASSGKQAL
jgi:hypothetical protein